jgi:hypothetical protein
MSLIYKDEGRGLMRKGGYPPHPQRFEQAGFDLQQLLDATVVTLREVS